MKLTVSMSTFAAATLCLLLNGCSKEEANPAKSASSLPVSPISVATVQSVSAARLAEVVGTVQAVAQAEIAAKISGNIITMPVDLGSRVERDELLVELVAGEISAQLQQAEAQLAQARRNLAREESLLKKNAATQETVKSLQDTLKIAEASFRQAQTMLDYTRITAPFSGIITRKFANVGDLATPGRTLLKIESAEQLEVVTDLPEAMMLQVNKGDILPVFIPSIDLQLDGVVAEVSPTADPTSRTVPIKLRLPGHPTLRAGQFARVTLASNETETLTVPGEALLPLGQIERLFVVEDGVARLRLVRSGTRQDGRVEILSGLQGQEQVVVAGNRRLQDGQPVEIR